MAAPQIEKERPLPDRRLQIARICATSSLHAHKGA